MSDFNIDFKDPTTWLLAPLLAPLLPLALLSSCAGSIQSGPIKPKPTKPKATESEPTKPKLTKPIEPELTKSTELTESRPIQSGPTKNLYSEPTDTYTDMGTNVDVDTVQTIVAGGYHTCALLASGDMKCWGDNEYGQLGNGISGDGEYKTTPVDVSDLSSGVQDIAIGCIHTCALLASGGVKCWGNNEYGQLGNGISGDGEYKTTPVDVSGLSSGVQVIATGTWHTCALVTPGGIKCWGSNENGQLVNKIPGDEEYKTTPVDVSGLTSGVQAIVAGSVHTCDLFQSGGVKCWGDNHYGQLGDGTSNYQTTPIDVSGLSSGVQDIAAGRGHTCALLDSGGVKCWGNNYWGQLGNGTTGFGGTTPVDVVGLSSGVQAITAGWKHTCALLDSGGVKCWGNNHYGQLGDETKKDKTTPVDVSGLSSGVKAIAAGDEHTCALLQSGGIKCWGNNGAGQLGDGTTEGSSTPVDVSGF